MEFIKRGKVLVIVMISVCLTISFISFALSASLEHTSGETLNAIHELVQGFIRFILECALFFFLFKGHKWAKITTMVLYGIGAIGSLITMFSTHMLMAVFFISYSAFFIILLLKPVNAFLEFQRGKRAEEKPIEIS